jgi:hypothetical protein
MGAEVKMNEKRLTEAITEGGIQWINFFNGRLLSGEDLSKEQSSNFEGRRKLGRAIGEGIAYGLEVSVPKGIDTRREPSVLVEAGLALNRQGQTLSLQSQTRVRLARPLMNADAPLLDGGDFADCQPLQTGVYVAEAGVYLLTIAPSRTSEGRAPSSGLDNTIARCNTHHTVEGVQFRLIQLGLNEDLLKDPRRLRNRVAYQCFGINPTSAATALTVNPLSAPSPAATLLNDLRPRLLTDCDVPLAILYWTSMGGIVFVDLWSVRRRLFAPATSGQWEAVLSERRLSESEAMFLQFQEEIKWSEQNLTNFKSLAAEASFDYLPPVGVIPLATKGSPQGFDYRLFFQNQTCRQPVFIEGARFERLIREALRYPPLEMGSGELIWLYEVRQNMQAIAEDGGSAPQAYLIFCNGHMPFCGEARFDVNRYDYSNYSSAYD